MAQNVSKSRVNPQISATVEKNQLKKVDEEVKTMKNRVQLLKQQLQKQKDNIRKNKQLVKDVIERKIAVNKINQYKQKDNTQEQTKLQQLRKRNRQFRHSHQKQLENIQKAIYLVKLDDARQVKNISIEHERKIKDRERRFLTAQQEKKNKMVEESQRAKEKYMQFWKEKLKSLYTEQAQTLINTLNQKQNKKKQLSCLEQQQANLLEQINKYHSISVSAKKQYIAALNLPVKDVAEAMGQSISPKKSLANSSLSIHRKIDNPSSFDRKSLDAEIRLPNANVNQTKLKIILSQLKKTQKSQSRYIE